MTRRARETCGLMHIIEDVQSRDRHFPRVVLTIGSFDGVHRGHRAVLDAVVATAQAIDGTPAVLTMRPHPRQFFAPDSAPNLLTTDDKKAELIADAGIEALFFLPFDGRIAALDKTAFVEGIVRDRCGAGHLIVGHDFCFGKDASGDYAFLKEVGPRYDLQVQQVPPLLVEGERISSTRIRELILQGELDLAARLLGRRYAITGQIVTGRGMGAKLGYPTANISPHHSAVPAHGVYAAEALIGNGRHAAAVNIGIAPTIRHEDITVEAYLLDFDGDILGNDIELVFHRRLRPERKFPSHEALIAQIHEDVVQVRKLLAAEAQSDLGNPP